MYGKRFCMGLLLTACLLGVFLGKAEARIIIGISSVNLAFLPIYVSKEKKFFDQEGLEVLLVMFNSGTTNLQATVAGDVHVMATSVLEPINGRNAGADLKIFWGQCNLMPFQMYSQPEFTSLKDAKGKRFAVSRFGSLADFLTRSALLHAGVDPKEVAILQIGSTPARYAALTAKGVDATAIWFPVTETAKNNGYRMLLDFKDIFSEWPFEVFAAKASWLNKEKETATKLLRAYKKGVQYTLDNKKEAVDVLKKYVKIDPSVAAVGYDQYRDSFPIDGRIAEKGIAVVLDQELKNGRLKKQISVEEMIDRSFINLLGSK